MDVLQHAIEYSHQYWIHKEALRTVYGHNSRSSQELFYIDNSLTIHQRNWQILATEVVKNDQALLKGLLELSELFYELRSNVYKGNQSDA